MIALMSVWFLLRLSSCSWIYREIKRKVTNRPCLNCKITRKLMTRFCKSMQCRRRGIGGCLRHAHGRKCRRSNQRIWRRRWSQSQLKCRMIILIWICIGIRSIRLQWARSTARMAAARYRPAYPRENGTGTSSHSTKVLTMTWVRRRMQRSVGWWSRPMTKEFRISMTLIQTSWCSKSIHSETWSARPNTWPYPSRWKVWITLCSTGWAPRSVIGSTEWTMPLRSAIATSK